MKDRIKAYSTISRFEYLPGVAPGIFVPIFIGAATLSVVFSMVFIEAVLVFVLLYFSGFVINSLVDRDMDSRYNTFKGNIADSVNLLGTGTVKGILGVQVGLALLISLHISYVLQNPLILVLVALGALFGLGYSIKPFHFKVKGIWHAIALASSAFFIPLLFLYLVIAETVEILDVLVILGVTIAHYSMEMGNQAADHLEDSEEGLLTPTVRLGLDKALRASIFWTTAGMVFTILIIGIMYMTSGFSETVGLGTGTAAVPAMVFVIAIMAVIIVMGYYVPLKGLKDLYGYSITDIPLAEQVAKIKDRIEYAKWQAYGIVGVVVALAVLFGASLQAPVMHQNDLINDIDETTAELDLNQLRIANLKVTTHNEGKTNNYADVTVRMSLQTLDDNSDLSGVSAYVQASTGNKLLETSSNNVDQDGRATVRIYLQGYNESEVWYYAYLVYEGKKSSYTWTEPSVSDLYIFDARLKNVDEGSLIQDKYQITIKTYNAGPIRDAGTITIKIEWAPLVTDWISNNATVKPQQVWEISVKKDMLNVISDSSSVKISLYYDDTQFDEMLIEF